MKKHIIIFLIFTFLFIPINVFASYDAVITGDYVKVREEATTNSKTLFSLGINTRVTVLSKDLITSTNTTCKSNKWYNVMYKNTNGYVCSDYVSIIDGTFNGVSVMDYSARVNGNNVYVRKSPTTSSESLDKLSLGTNVGIIEELPSNSANCNSKRWYKIQYYGNKIGYMCKDYVTKKSEITYSDPAYEKELREAKVPFPESYIPYLSYLHKKYPKWNFVAINTGYSFASAVDCEEGKNLMQTNNKNFLADNYTSSTESSAWKKVNSNVIAFYMDPRNWLTEERIFMFENLQYSDALTPVYPSLIKSIFSNGKLADDKYTIPMFNSGAKNKVSPLAIATRIRLEVGINGSDSTNGTSFTWEGKTYSGYYNFFNIGAYSDTINGVRVNSLKRGLLYAAKLIRRDGKVWDNIETSISEGSNLLSSGYIKSGQDTLYYQHFNVAPDAYYSSFTHQYQTNIQAPATEGNQTYNSYRKANILNNAFTFEIPVYNNMPEYTSLPNSGDTNNNLKDLKVEGYSITPSFDDDVLNYEVYVPKSTNAINVIAEKESELSTISGNGKIELDSDETTLTIKIVSQSGNEKKYTLEIHRVDDNTKVKDVIEKSSIILNNNYLTKIRNNTNVQQFKINLIKNGARNVTITDRNGNNLSDKAIIGTGNKITISTSIETITFTASINGDTSGDGLVTILDLLEVQKHIKKASLLSEASLLAADTSGDNNVTILDLLEIVQHIKKYKLL